MKYYRNFFTQLKIYVLTPMSCTTKFASYMTMTSNFVRVIIDKFFANPASVTPLKLFFLLLFVLFRYFFTVLILFKNSFNKLISSIFTSKNSSWFTKSIINTNNFYVVSKTARNVILILF